VLTGTLFLEFWKRKEATIGYKWDLTNFVASEVKTLAKNKLFIVAELFIDCS
jgi:hypothetical protein